MNNLKLFFTSLLTSYGIGIFVILINILIIGEVYWLYCSYQIGSFLMGIIGISPLGIFTAPMGAYSLIFGMPDWLISWFS